MSSLLKTKKQKDLLTKWNKKLEKYDDCNIENYNFDEPILKEWHNFHFKKYGKDQYESRLTYFGNARTLLETGKFKNKLYRKVWEYHSEGLSLREISREISKTFRRRNVSESWKKYSKDAVRKIINEIAKDQMPK